MPTAGRSPDVVPPRRPDAWEAAFAPDAEPRVWGGGWLYTVDAPPRPDFTRVDGAPRHAVLFFPEGAPGAEEREPGGPARRVGPLAPGDVLVYSPDGHARPQLARWPRPLRFVALFLDPGVVAEAARTFGRDRATFPEVQAARDPLLAGVVGALVEGAAAGAAGAGAGSPYAKHLVDTAALHLAARYATGPAAGGDFVRAFRGGRPAPRLRRVRDYVQAHLGGVVRVDDLAREAGLSRWHFSRAFFDATGETPACYVRRARLEYAARLLRTTARPVLRVAYDAGFESPSHLTALFRRYLGVPPGAYRAAARRRPHPA